MLLNAMWIEYAIIW